jgi:4-hydroxy-4-methyl-2-oxoglutarate aldolase
MAGGATGNRVYELGEANALAGFNKPSYLFENQNTPVMKKLIALILFLCFWENLLICQTKDTISNKCLLDLYKELRVANVSDGMDMVGLRDVGLLSQEIEALWKNIEDFSHVFRGIAVTARYVPTNKVVKNPMSEEEFKCWEGQWYNTISNEPFVVSLTEGSVVVLDVQGDGDCGSVGSYNSLAWVSAGAVGIVSNGGIRDSDEIIKQEIPVYLDIKNRGRGIRPGRNEIESVNKPVSIGGVLIRPGDVIVADGDGVVAVPREYAVQVAEYAQTILNNDKKGRRNLYEQMHMPMDHTVTP